MLFKALLFIIHVVSASHTILRRHMSQDESKNSGSFWLDLTHCLAVQHLSDGVCYRTQLANRTSELLLTEHALINDMAFDGQSSALWVATASSAVRRCASICHMFPHICLVHTSQLFAWRPAF